MTNGVTEETARVIAQWWKEQLKHPTKDMGTEGHGGNSMTTMFALLLAHESTVSGNQLDNFEEALVKIIVEEKVTELSCDYGPNIYLGRAAEEAGIDTNRFPWKSRTNIRHDGTVEAKLGYEGVPTIIYNDGFGGYKRHIEVNYNEAEARKERIKELQLKCNHRDPNTGESALIYDLDPYNKDGAALSVELSLFH